MTPSLNDRLRDAQIEAVKKYLALVMEDASDLPRPLIVQALVALAVDFAPSIAFIDQVLDQYRGEQ